MSVLLLSIMVTNGVYANEIDKTEHVRFTIVTQENTGRYSSTNCGIASLKMALNFLGEEGDSVADLREQIRPEAGLVYTNEIIDFMQKKEMPYKLKTVKTEDDIIQALNSGITLLCLDIGKVLGLSSSGHFIVGTSVIYDEQTGTKYLRTYDSLSSKVQYYDLAEVTNSAKEWWGWMITFDYADRFVKQ